MKRWKLAAATAAGWMALAAAPPSFGESGESFVRAVRDKDGAKVEELLQESGQTIINARDVNGDTALMVAVGRRDDTWTGFLLTNGADPNLANRKGDTPLIVASRIGYMQGAEWLMAKRARVDEANRMGETALIAAVQARQAPLVKFLIGKGADPDKTDTAAGYSARDYAKRDSRNPELLRIIESAKKKTAASAR